MERTLLTTAEVALKTGLSQETLRGWRYRSIGPRYFKLGTRKIVYDESDVTAWIKSQREQQGGDAA